MNLTPATVTALVDLVVAKGTVYQDELAKVCDIVKLFNNGKQIKACGLSMGYADTRRGYFLKASNA